MLDLQQLLVDFRTHPLGKKGTDRTIPYSYGCGIEYKQSWNSSWIASFKVCPWKVWRCENLRSGVPSITRHWPQMASKRNAIRRPSGQKVNENMLETIKFDCQGLANSGLGPPIGIPEVSQLIALILVLYDHEVRKWPQKKMECWLVEDRHCEAEEGKSTSFKRGQSKDGMFVQVLF